MALRPPGGYPIHSERPELLWVVFSTPSARVVGESQGAGPCVVSSNSPRHRIVKNFIILSKNLTAGVVLAALGDSESRDIFIAFLREKRQAVSVREVLRGAGGPASWWGVP